MPYDVFSRYSYTIRKHYKTYSIHFPTEDNLAYPIRKAMNLIKEINEEIALPKFSTV